MALMREVLPEGAFADQDDFGFVEGRVGVFEVGEDGFSAEVGDFGWGDAGGWSGGLSHSRHNLSFP